ncbi:MAG TPA: response regulator transcription factor [Candidatus Obscuribacterales bacterium]
MGKILVIEDEEDLAEEIRDWLSHDGYVVDVVHQGNRALDYLASYKYDAIVLDWMLPGIDGLEVLRQFRSAGGNTPVIMLTARSALEYKQKGLDSGCDDYLTKPFLLGELSARIRALIRRASPATSLSNTLTAGDVVLDPTSRTVLKGDVPVHLEPKEFNLLEFLMRNANKTFSAEALIQRVWESETHTTADTLRTYIRALRRKIDSPGQTSIITTVHGVGYKVEHR